MFFFARRAKKNIQKQLSVSLRKPYVSYLKTYFTFYVLQDHTSPRIAPLSNRRRGRAPRLARRGQAVRGGPDRAAAPARRPPAQPHRPPAPPTPLWVPARPARRLPCPPSARPPPPPRPPLPP